MVPQHLTLAADHYGLQFYDLGLVADDLPRRREVITGGSLLRLLHHTLWTFDIREQAAVASMLKTCHRTVTKHWTRRSFEHFYGRSLTRKAPLIWRTCGPVRCRRMR